MLMNARGCIWSQAYASTVCKCDLHRANATTTNKDTIYIFVVHTNMYTIIHEYDALHIFIYM